MVEPIAQSWRIKLGEYPPLTCERARDLAHHARNEVYEAQRGIGLHPAAKRDTQQQEAPKEDRHTLLSKISIYLERRKSGLRPKTFRGQQLYLNSHWKALHNLALDKISRADIATSLGVIEKNSGPVAANRARSTLSKFFASAIGEGYCEANPVVGTNLREENKPRERSLSDAEVASVWLGAPDNDYGSIIKLLLLTGCRRAEIGGLRWSEIDLEARTITLPGDRTKNKQQHVVPLTDTTMAILANVERQADRDWVFGKTRGSAFAGFSKQKKRLDDAVKLAPWTIHDLRRTVRTGLGKLGVVPHVAEAVINHLSPKLIRTYDRNSYEAEKRAALDQWATHIKTIVAQATGANVTPIRKKERRE